MVLELSLIAVCRPRYQRNIVIVLTSSSAAAFRREINRVFVTPVRSEGRIVGLDIRHESSRVSLRAFSSAAGAFVFVFTPCDKSNRRAALLWFGTTVLLRCVPLENWRGLRAHFLEVKN